MSEKDPLITLIMPTLDAEEYIEEALVSIFSQPDANKVQIVVADGGSRDRTLSILHNYPTVRVLEGSDDGIYAGLNRGLLAAEGDAVGFLNADDFVLPGSIGVIRKFLILRPDVEMFSSGIRVGANIFSSQYYHHRSRLTFEGALFGSPAINSRFLRRAALSKLGMFDEDIGLAADRKFIAQLTRKNIKSKNIPTPLYFYRQHKNSRTITADMSSRKRVWEADMKLCTSLLKESSLNKREKSIIFDYFSVLNIKYSLMRNTINIFQKQSYIQNLPYGLTRWLRWRGKLSGY